MQVAKWGNSLAVRLPAKVVRKMNLKPGDEVEIQPRGPLVLEIGLDAEEQVEHDRRREALDRLRALRSRLPSLPEGYKFNRAEIYDESLRGHEEDSVS